MDAKTPIAGLVADGEPVDGGALEPRCVLVVGHERRGLGRWEALCARRLAIAMPGPAESLNAAVAGSIALYEAARKPRTQGAQVACQESPDGAKSQD